MAPSLELSGENAGSWNRRGHVERQAFSKLFYPVTEEPINKDQATDKIVEAIRRVLQGKVYLSDAMAEKMLHRAVGGGRDKVTRSPLDALADRELEVFRLIGQGVKTAEIAERLHLSVKTVETYRDRIRQKLDLTDGMELAHCATQWVLENG